MKEQEESISKIYILASKKVKEAKYFFYQGKECNWSHIDVFKRRLIGEIGMSEDQFEEIDYDENQTVDMNMNTLLELAIKLRKEHCADKDAMIHFDMTGGITYSYSAIKFSIIFIETFRYRSRVYFIFGYGKTDCRKCQ